MLEAEWEVRRLHPDTSWGAGPRLKHFSLCNGFTFFFFFLFIPLWRRLHAQLEARRRRWSVILPSSALRERKTLLLTCTRRLRPLVQQTLLRSPNFLIRKGTDCIDDWIISNR